LRLAIQATGTFGWELAVAKSHGLDKQAGLDIQTTELATTEAGKIALVGGGADIILSDWLWVARERGLGNDMQFYPHSTALGAVMAKDAGAFKKPSDFIGKKLGVAGGPLDKSWLLMVAYALRTANLDLRSETKQEFGAPPLLSERAKEGELDAVLNFWPYAARLEAEGFTQLIGIEDVVSELGAKGEVAMVGFVFSDGWAKDHLEAAQGFLRAAAKADELLATSDEQWERLKPLMAENDPNFNDATFKALKRRYQEGIPERSVAENETDAKVLYQFLRELGGEKLVGPATELAPGTFWHDGKP
jgi:NitT/TauT family transport system substrate-binding protein